MRALLQRVSQASVEVEGQIVGQIGPGLLVLLGVGPNDTAAVGQKLLQKILALRIFQDEAGKMNLCLTDTGGGLLVVSQFTLFGDCRKGNRPSFTQAGPPALAQQLYDTFVAEARAQHKGEVACGIFAADMKVALVNDGPVTLWLDTEA